MLCSPIPDEALARPTAARIRLSQDFILSLPCFRLVVSPVSLAGDFTVTRVQSPPVARHRWTRCRLPGIGRPGMPVLMLCSPIPDEALARPAAARFRLSRDFVLSRPEVRRVGKEGTLTGEFTGTRVQSPPVAPRRWTP